MQSNETCDVAPSQWNTLEASAQSAAQAAYAPYSKYHVGAALLTENENVYTGCNVENASYGLTMCAERTAVFKAVTDGQTKFKALVIAGGTDSAPAFPCGACLQVLSEFCTPAFPIRCIPLSSGKCANAHTYTLGELMPNMFKLA